MLRESLWRKLEENIERFDDNLPCRNDIGQLLAGADAENELKPDENIYRHHDNLCYLREGTQKRVIKKQIENISHEMIIGDLS